jgi:Zn-dependent metalloprotease
VRSTPKRRAVTIGAAVAAAALLAVSVQAGTASAGAATTSGAAPVALSAAGSDARPGALPRELSPSLRAQLISEAEAGTTAAAGRLGLGAQEKLVVKDVVQDADGTTHTRYERTYQGLPVLGGDMVVATSSAGAVKSVDKASTAALTGVATTAAVTPAAARKQALSAASSAGSSSTAPDTAPRKVVWMAQGAPVLAYETVVGGLQEDGTPNQLHVVTDASTGKKLFQWQGIETGVGNTEYSGQVTVNSVKSGSTYQLTDSARGGHNTYNLNRATSGRGTLFAGPDDVWGNGSGTNTETPAADAAYGAGLTWDYYKNVHGRTGIKGNGVAAYSRVHYSSGYVNAFWDDSCFCMTYGDGAGNRAPLTAVDVAGHEMSHGVTAATAGLVYSGESGGLNEATSDIFGTAVEWFANNATDPGDYLIGEKININGDGSPLRYMDQPSKDGGSADYWSSSVGRLDVHYSSGVANHFFYLLSEGSGAKTVNGVKYNSPTADGKAVTGIGRAKAEQIWFRALSTKFTSNTNYASARTGTLAAAADLYGSGSAEYNAVANAWAAVKVGARP